MFGIRTDKGTYIRLQPTSVEEGVSTLFRAPNGKRYWVDKGYELCCDFAHVEDLSTELTLAEVCAKPPCCPEPSVEQRELDMDQFLTWTLDYKPKLMAVLKPGL